MHAERGEARTALRAFATGNIEPWIAEQPWEPATCGWTVAGIGDVAKALGRRHGSARKG